MPVMEDLYPSRTAEVPSVSERQDPVVYGSPEDGHLTDADLRLFDTKGYLFMESLFSSEEISDLNAELRSLGESAELRNSEDVIREPESDEVRSIFRIHKISRLFNRLARDPRLLDAARQILGSEVYIHQSRVNLKPGFSGRDFYWHSDFETWHVEDGMPRMRALSVSLSLTRNYPFNGPLMVMPGSHRYYISCVGETPEDHYRQSLRKQEYGVPDHESLKRLADEGGIVDFTGAAGSAVFFDCNEMHGSNSNITPYPRNNAFFVYNSVENALEAPFGGTKPRPEQIATRESFEPLKPLERE